MPKDTDARAGVAVIRVWVEAEQVGNGASGLRARVTTVEHGDPASEQSATAAGIGDVIALVEQFLTGLTDENAGGPD